MKRILTLAVIVAILIPSLNIVSVSAKEYSTKTLYTNVAEGKSVTTNVELENDEQSQMWGAASLTDGDISTMALMLGKDAIEYFTVDLGQRYKISEIKLYDRQDLQQVPEARYGIRILLSNDENFEIYEIADEIGTATEECFAEGGTWNIGLSENRAYRYVRFERYNQRENWWIFYNELEVYANVKMNNVSAGKKAYSNDWYDKENDVNAANNYSPTRVLDDEISMDNRWLSYYGENGENGFTYLAVDLQQERNIGYIELERVNNSQTPIEQFYSNFDIYLTNKYEPDVLSSESILKDNPDYMWVSGCNVATAAQWQNGIYTAKVSGGKYRYVIYKHNKENCVSELGAVRIYEPAAEVNTAEFNGETVTVSFNDEIDEEEIKNICVYDRTENKNIDVSIQKKDAYTYDFISGQLSADHNYNVIIPEGLSSLKGMAVAADVAFLVKNVLGLTVTDTIVTDNDGKICNEFINNSMLRISSEVINNTDENKKVIIFAALYRDGSLLEVKCDEKDIKPQRADRCNIKLDCSVTQHNDVVKIFAWDLTDNLQKPIHEVQFIAEQSNEIYVSPDGDDNGRGTQNDPFKSIERAKEKVREINTDMNSDINVYLSDGLYQLSKTLDFSARDGGTNGYNVNYKALGSSAEISGGRTVSGWNRYTDKIWCADYDGGEYVRQLTVNGRSAVRAKSAEMVEITDFYKDDAGYNSLENVVYDGLTLRGSKYSYYKNPQDIQIHTASGWRSYLLNIEGITEDKDGNSRVKLPEKSFFECTKSENQHRIYPGYHVWVENAFEELDEPGEFYYDRAAKKIYYYPREDEAIETADVQAALLEKLISICGESSSKPVKNISFNGITFAHATWLRPSVAGLVNDQAQAMLPDDRDICVAGGVGFDSVPSNINIQNAVKICFVNNKIYDMGSVAIGLNQGVSDSVFTGNTFYDVADSAITIGNMDIPFEDETYSGRNLTPGGIITASSYDGKNYPQNAVNGDIKTLWAPNVDGACWWQIDFGSPQKIDRLEFESRYDSTDDAGNYNIEIYGANNDDMSDKELIGKTGEESVDGIITVRTSTKNKYRFIRLEKSYYMTLSNVRMINEDLQYAPAVKLCENNTVDGNYITRIGRTNYGAPAIQAYYTRGTEIINNHINDVPYSGICVGWGWDAYSDNTDSGKTTISHNKIENYLQKTYDGGGIYLLGGMPDTEVYENYIYNQINGLAAIYLDAGTNGCRIYNNVSEDVPAAYAASMGSKNDIVENNYSSAVTCLSPMSEAEFKNNSVFVPGAYNDKIATIVDQAGRIPAETIAYAGKNYSPDRKKYMFINAADTKAPEGEYMSDSYFAEWWLGIYLDSAQTWLEMTDGQSKDVIVAFAEFVSDTRKKLDEGLKDRNEIINLYWQFCEMKNQLKVSKT